MACARTFRVNLHAQPTVVEILPVRERRIHDNVRRMGNTCTEQSCTQTFHLHKLEAPAREHFACIENLPANTDGTHESLWRPGFCAFQISGYRFFGRPRCPCTRVFTRPISRAGQASVRQQIRRSAHENSGRTKNWTHEKLGRTKIPAHEKLCDTKIWAHEKLCRTKIPARENLCCTKIWAHKNLGASTLASPAKSA